MKIIYYAHSVLSRGGDKMILAHLAHLAASGHQVVLEASLVDTVFDIHPFIQIIKIGGKSKLSSVLNALWVGKDADIVIASIIPMACFLTLRNPRRVVYFAQDYDESYYAQKIMRLMVRSCYLIGLCWLKIPVVAVSDNLQETLRRRFKAEVTVVTNGVDLEVFFPDPNDELISQKGERQAILVLSRSDWRKGFDLTKRVFEKLRNDTNVSFEVWSVGESSTLCFNEVIHRDFGYVREDELRQIMSSADIFFYPTRHEGFGLMVAEAFACECPVVTTDAVPFAEDGKNALVSPIENVDAMTVNLLKLLLDPELCGQLVRISKSFVQRYSLALSCNKFEDVLIEMYNSR